MDCATRTCGTSPLGHTSCLHTLTNSNQRHARACRAAMNFGPQELRPTPRQGAESFSQIEWKQTVIREGARSSTLASCIKYLDPTLTLSAPERSKVYAVPVCDSQEKGRSR